MARFDMEKLQRNAFRILGLKAGATQAEIDSAARLMRLFNDSTQIPPSANDADWLGELPRTLSDVEDAATRLAHPESRIEERLWWFFVTPMRDHMRLPLTAASPVEQIHAAGLSRLRHLLPSKVACRNLDKWHLLLEIFSQLAHCEEFRALQVQAEIHGEFEKCANAHEIAAAQAAMPERIATVLADAADKAFFRDDLRMIRKILGSLQSLQCCRNTNHLLLDTLEDYLASSFNQARDDIHKAWKRKQIAPLRGATEKVIKRVNRFYEPLLQQLLLRVPPEDKHKRDRLKGALIQLLNYCAKAFAGCYDYIAATSILEKAIFIGQGTPMLAMLNNHRESIRPDARWQFSRLKFSQKISRWLRQRVARFTMAHRPPVALTDTLAMIRAFIRYWNPLGNSDPRKPQRWHQRLLKTMAILIVVAMSFFLLGTLIARTFNPSLDSDDAPTVETPATVPAPVATPTVDHNLQQVAPAVMPRKN